MSAEVDVYEAPPPPAVPAPALPVPALNDFDSWTVVVAQVVRLAREICDTPFVPDGLRGSAPATAAAILAGREMGLGPMTSLQHIHVIKGKPGQSALLMRALIISAGHQWQDVDVSDVRAVVRGRRKGESEWAEATFTAAQAKIAGLELGRYPQDKLYARATVRLARRKFGDVILGMPYSAEELEDGDVDEGAVTAAEQPAAIEPPKPLAAPARTAKRRTATAPAAAVPDDKAPSGPAAAAGTTPPAPADASMPPLPGEEEITAPVSGDEARAPEGAKAGSSGPGAAETAPGDDKHRKLVGLVQQHFKRILGRDVKDETEEQRAERLWMASKLAGIANVESLNDLDPEELSTVADTLAKCRDRKRLEEILAAAGEGGGDG